MKRETNTITNIGKHMSYGVGSYIYIYIYIYMRMFNVVDITTSLFLFFFVNCFPLPLYDSCVVYRFILIFYWGDKNRKRKIPCTDSNRFTLL